MILVSKINSRIVYKLYLTAKDINLFQKELILRVNPKKSPVLKDFHRSPCFIKMLLALRVKKRKVVPKLYLHLNGIYRCQKAMANAILATDSLTKE